MDAQTSIKPKILIIEDNTDILDMYQLKFVASGFDVATATDGEKGIVKAVEFKPDAIMLDLLMPNMDGFQVLQAIKQNTGLKAKIVVLSNLGLPEQISRAKEMGAAEYLVKASYQPSEVVAKIKSLLGLESAPEQPKQSQVGDTVTELQDLKKLLDQGVITQTEFDQMKERILKDVKE